MPPDHMAFSLLNLRAPWHELETPHPDLESGPQPEKRKDKKDSREKLA